METSEELQKFNEKLQNNSKPRVSLFFVLKDKKKGTNNQNTNEFKLIRAPIDKEIANYFLITISNQISEYLNKADLVIKNYSPIDDDLENKIYTYDLSEDLPFYKLINEYIKDENICELNDLITIKDNAFCYFVKLQYNDNFVYLFKKITKSKVITDKNRSLKESLYAFFDESSCILKNFEGSILSLNKDFDSLIINKKFYIFNKKMFESVVGMDEEFKEVAQTTLESIKNMMNIEGLEIIEQVILEKTSWRKILCKIGSSGIINALDELDINKINKILDKLKRDKLKVDANGRIRISSKQECDELLRVLNDYYKKGLTTNKYYGTNSGDIIEPKNS